MIHYEDNIEFNEFLDSMGEPVEVAGSIFFRSKILFEMEIETYELALQDWKDNQEPSLLDRARECLSLRANQDRFSTLVDIVRRKRVVPFVGAGLSMACGLPGWKQFLVKVADHSGMDTVAVERRLMEGEYEEVADEICGRLGAPGFNERIESVFGKSCEVSEAIALLPTLANGCVITTNFDSLVELAFAERSARFEEIMIGNREGGFLRALAEARPSLLKLHGDAKDMRTRILTLAEYQEAYGAGGINFERPLPKILKRVFSHHCLLFLGCSLGPDRTLSLFQQVSQGEAEHELPRHYAIVELPENTEEIPERERFLTDRMIFPIWYPNGDHEILGGFLQLLCEETAS